MKHVRLTVDAGSREGEIHPMYDVFANAPFVDRATATCWNFTGDELGIVHYVEGDVARFRDAVESIPEVLACVTAPAGDDAFYAYVRDATTGPLRALFGAATDSAAVVIPPLEYRPDGSVCYSVFGPSAAIQDAVEAVSGPVDVTVEEVGGFAAAPGVLDSQLTDRQREAVEVALELGYYEVPREAGHAAVADGLDCAPSTAAEHLRKAESTLVRSAMRR